MSGDRTLKRAPRPRQVVLKERKALTRNDSEGHAANEHNYCGCLSRRMPFHVLGWLTIYTHLTCEHNGFQQKLVLSAVSADHGIEALGAAEEKTLFLSVRWSKTSTFRK